MGVDLVRLSLLLALVAGATACATRPPAQVAAAPPPPAVEEPPPTCGPGESRATTAELIFGRNLAGGLAMTDADWRKFIEEDVSPRFPDGLSVMDVDGQWRASDGQLVQEPSKVLYLVLDGGPDDPAKISNIREAYKRRFQQESVLSVTRAACVSDPMLGQKP